MRSWNLSETITADRYRQQIIKLDRAIKDKRPRYDGRYDKIILQHDNAMPHVAKTVQETLQVLNWEILPHPPYSPDIAPSAYYLFRSMHSALLGKRFSSYEEVTKWVDNGLLPRNQIFFIAESICCLKMGNVVLFNGKYFEWNIFYFTISISALLFIKNGDNLVVHPIINEFCSCTCSGL